MASVFLSASRVVSAAAVVLLLSGCVGSFGPQGASTYDSSTVVNRTDQFVLSGSVGNLTKDTSYTWQTTRGHPTASWSGYLSSGKMTMTVRDQLGQTLYQRTYTTATSSSGSEQLSGTVGGSWTITVRYEAATASLSFNLD